MTVRLPGKGYVTMTATTPPDAPGRHQVLAGSRQQGDGHQPDRRISARARTAQVDVSRRSWPHLGSQIYTMAGMVTRLHLQADQPGNYPRGMSAQYSGAKLCRHELSMSRPLLPTNSRSGRTQRARKVVGYPVKSAEAVAADPCTASGVRYSNKHSRLHSTT